MDAVLMSIAQFAGELRYEDLPQPVVAAAKLRRSQQAAEAARQGHSLLDAHAPLEPL